MKQVFAVLVPQVNVNEEEVLFVEWLVEHGASVNPGDVICAVETSKALTELPAEHSGVIYQIAAPKSLSKIGQRIGLIGRSLDAIETYLSDEEGTPDEMSLIGIETLSVKSTPKAQALATHHGITLEAVAAMGVVGTIKETDVQRYLSGQGGIPESPEEDGALGGLSPGVLRRVVQDGQLTRHEVSVVRNLRQSVASVLLATVDAEPDLTSVKQGIQLAQDQGTMLSLLHVVMRSLGRTLSHYPRLISFRHGQEVFRYRELDVAFVTRTADGRLYTPVVRGVDKLDVRQIARACYAATIGVNRGEIKPEELDGACFTVSHIATRGATRFVALPNRWQSSILAIAAERSMLRLRDGQVSQVPTTTFTLSYDHALCDGVYAAEFLHRLMEEMELVLTNEQD